MPSVLILDSAGAARDVVALMKAAKVHAGGFEYMVPKFSFFLVKIRNLEHRAANVLKQELLSLGHDAAVSMDVSLFREGRGDVVFGATRRAVEALAEKLQEQPFGLPAVGRQVREALENFSRSAPHLPLADGRKVPLGDRPLVAGVLNVTPDSFSDGGRLPNVEAAVERALEMAEEGADMIDVGGESTRPGASAVPEDEELRRVVPVVEAVRKRSPVLLSVDTRKAAVARAAIEGGADVLNDVSAGRSDGEMLPLAAGAKAPVILMHMQGTPETMQENPSYDDVLFDVAEFFRERIEAAERAGVARERVVLDPGIGFGKTVEHNLVLLNHAQAFRSLGRPLMVGVSRKSFLGKILKLPVEKRLEGGLAAQALAYLKGVRIFRTHDVRAARRVLDALQAVAGAAPTGLVPGEDEGEAQALHVC
ncbi:MAG: dihydropteroate synthase [Acidobacteriota bacterium]|nr:MAG: dihydropteroate synthase [Acidobacteriota bacterium]